MESQQKKVTLYLPNELHRQLKIKSAIEAEPMSTLAERALSFYINHAEVVDAHEGHGQVHRVYNCPGCEGSYVLRDGELMALASDSAVLEDSEELSMPLPSQPVDADLTGEQELVPC